MTHFTKLRYQDDGFGNLIQVGYDEYQRNMTEYCRYYNVVF